MARGFVFLTALCFVLLSGYGCGIKAHTYVMERERVDQANTGNAGYVKGEGSSMAGRPTRKVYVLELEREKKDVKKSATVKPAADAQAAATQGAPEQAASSIDEKANVTASAVESAEEKPAVASGDQKFTEYKVEKDDTLQKISKKFYSSYGKWTKIYDANKDKIKNPNFVKPGTVLQIPVE